MGDFPVEDLPTEETLIKVEDAGKNARDKGRKYIGSSEGEDLQVNFRPSWTRTPQLDVMVGDGSFEDKMKSLKAEEQATDKRMGKAEVDKTTEKSRKTKK